MCPTGIRLAQVPLCFHRKAFACPTYTGVICSKETLIAVSEYWLFAQCSTVSLLCNITDMRPYQKMNHQKDLFVPGLEHPIDHFLRLVSYVMVVTGVMVNSHQWFDLLSVT